MAIVPRPALAKWPAKASANSAGDTAFTSSVSRQSKRSFSHRLCSGSMPWAISTMSTGRAGRLVGEPADRRGIEELGLDHRDGRRAGRAPAGLRRSGRPWRHRAPPARGRQASRATHSRQQCSAIADVAPMTTIFHACSAPLASFPSGGATWRSSCPDRDSVANSPRSRIGLLRTSLAACAHPWPDRGGRRLRARCRPAARTGLQRRRGCWKSSASVTPWRGKLNRPAGQRSPKVLSTARNEPSPDRAIASSMSRVASIPPRAAPRIDTG